MMKEENNKAKEKNSTPTKNSSILLIGCGAIGGPVAASIKSAQYNITVMVRREKQKKALEKHGIQIDGKSTKVNVITKLDNTQYDVVFLATKVTENDKLPKELGARLKKDGVLVALQNGNPLDPLEKKFSPKRVIGCVVGWGATMHSDTEFEVTSSGDFYIGMRSEKNNEALMAVQKMLGTIKKCVISENIDGHLYSKILINSCITSLGAISGQYLGEMLAKKHIRNLFIEIMVEGMNVAQAMGLKVETINHRLNYYDLLAKADFFSELKRHLLIWGIGFMYRRLKSSSLQSLERGLPTEISYLNGYIVKKADEHGISVPINRRVVEIVKEIEQEKRHIGMDNFKDAVFAPFHSGRPPHVPTRLQGERG